MQKFRIKKEHKELLFERIYKSRSILTKEKNGTEYSKTSRVTRTESSVKSLCRLRNSRGMSNRIVMPKSTRKGRNLSMRGLNPYRKIKVFVQNNPS